MTNNDGSSVRGKSGGSQDLRQGQGSNQYRNNQSGRHSNRRGDDRPHRTMDRPRRTALEVMRDIDRRGAYANLAARDAINEQGLEGRDAAFVTELVYGTCRMLGTYDAILSQAAQRDLNDLEPDIVDILRLGTHQALGMRVPDRAAVGTSVDLGAVVMGERVTGIINAIMRKVCAKDLETWCRQIAYDDNDYRCLISGHPDWIVDAYADVLPDSELDGLLTADNKAPVPTLVVHPGLYERDQLLEDGGGEPTQWSPWGVIRSGNPSDLEAVRVGKAGVQDEGSQLVCLALSRAGAPEGPWLDLCAGPGGKTALLRGLASRWSGRDAEKTGKQNQNGSHFLVANEAQEHRAVLVSKALRRYPSHGHEIVCGDGTNPSWQPNSFGLVLADVPCSGLGALRRRPDARWRREPDDIAELGSLQRELLAQAITSCAPGGLVAYVTCSPHRSETADIVNTVLQEKSLHQQIEILDAPSFLSEVPKVTAGTDPRFIQLWPHRHNTDAMFMALLRKC